jgi:hypothetical protein
LKLRTIPHEMPSCPCASRIAWQLSGISPAAPGLQASRMVMAPMVPSGTSSSVTSVTVPARISGLLLRCAWTATLLLYWSTSYRLVSLHPGGRLSWICCFTGFPSTG